MGLAPEKTLYYTALIVLVVLAAFVLNLTVLGSIFGIAPSPGAFLAWGILALILAYTYRLRLPLSGGLVAVVVLRGCLRHLAERRILGCSHGTTGSLLPRRPGIAGSPVGPASHPKS